MQFRRICAILALVIGGQSVCAEPLTARKQADIKRLIESTGSANMAKQFAATISFQFFQMIKVERPDIPERVLQIMEREVTAVAMENLSTPGGMLDMVIPVYHKYFTHQEIRGLQAFYRGKLGKKTISVMPNVLMESMMTGQSWALELKPEMERRISEALQKEGIDL